MKKWLNAELVVALVEGSISNGGRVFHNVTLRERATGAKRQCDVVIESGPIARRMITIVEVQARNRAVKVGEFEGWLQKRDALGVHQLICVASHKYTEAIVEKAKVDGRVRLVTLRDPGCRFWPGFVRSAQVTFEYMHVANVSDAELRVRHEAIVAQSVIGTLDADERVLRIGHQGGPTSTLRETVARLIPEAALTVPNEQPGEHTRSVRQEGVWLMRGNDWVEVDVSALLTFSVERHPVEVQALSYEQVGAANPDAWLLRGSVTTQGHSYEVELVVLPDEKGHFRLGSARLVNPRPGDALRVVVAGL